MVETRIIRIPLTAEGLVLESRETLPELHVAYEAYGVLSPARDNAIYICHALTGDAHVAGFHDMHDRKPGWWDAMVGPGKAFDTRRFFVVCANILGGCMGTTGPSSINPRTGTPYGSAFPTITTQDIVKVQYLLIRELGIKKLAAVVGGSFGGMQALAWAIQYPDIVETCMCIASAMNLSAQSLAFDIVGRNAILSDPAWNNGDYYETGKAPAQGLAQARMIGHITYLSSENMKQKFGREKKEMTKQPHRFATPFQVESYLDYQGEKFVNRFDANSYLHITEAMDHFDLLEGVADPAEAFAAVAPHTRFLVVALSSDWLFPPEQSIEVARALIRAGKRVSYCLLKSPYGHDAFLIEVDHLGEVVRAFLEASNTPNPAAALVASSAPDSLPAGAAVLTSAPAPATGDFDLIGAYIKPKAKVLDLGCGDGELLTELATRRQVNGLGMDIDLSNIIQVIRRGLEVIQCNLDEGLSVIPDNAYDFAILSQTLQVVHKPRLVLNEMLRVAQEGIVSFPNFGNWRTRFSLGLKGRMPSSESLPFEWYDTPNIHLATLHDFIELCRKDGIRIVDTVCIPCGRVDRQLIRLGWSNLGADRVLVHIARNR